MKKEIYEERKSNRIEIKEKYRERSIEGKQFEIKTYREKSK